MIKESNSHEKGWNSIELQKGLDNFFDMYFQLSTDTCQDLSLNSFHLLENCPSVSNLFLSLVAMKVIENFPFSLFTFNPLLYFVIPTAINLGISLRIET